MSAQLGAMMPEIKCKIFDVLGLDKNRQTFGSRQGTPGFEDDGAELTLRKIVKLISRTFRDTLTEYQKKDSVQDSTVLFVGNLDFNSKDDTDQALIQRLVRPNSDVKWIACPAGLLDPHNPSTYRRIRHHCETSSEFLQAAEVLSRSGAESAFASISCVVLDGRIACTPRPGCEAEEGAICRAGSYHRDRLTENAQEVLARETSRRAASALDNPGLAQGDELRLLVRVINENTGAGFSFDTFPPNLEFTSSLANDFVDIDDRRTPDVDMPTFNHTFHTDVLGASTGAGEDDIFGKFWLQCSKRCREASRATQGSTSTIHYYVDSDWSSAAKAAILAESAHEDFDDTPTIKSPEDLEAIRGKLQAIADEWQETLDSEHGVGPTGRRKHTLKLEIGVKPKHTHTSYTMPIAITTPLPAVGINGFGRIGRAVFRLSLTRPDLEIRAVNHTAHSIEHLLTAILYDSTHGQCPEARHLQPCPPDHPDLLPATPNNPHPSALLYKGRLIHLFSQRDASRVDWASAGVEVVMESTGKMLTRESAGVHIKHGGAKKVIISAPSKDCLNVVFGVNHSALYLKANMGNQDIISNASCTTNCLAPIAMVLHRSFGIETGMMTTVHASTSSQKVLDGFSSKDMRSGRSAMGNIIPASTGAAQAVVKVLPELVGKFHGISIRVPVTNVSLVDLTVTLSTPVSSKEELLLPFRRAAALPPSLFSGQARLQTPSVPPLAGVLGISDEQLVSSDFLGSTYSSIIDVDACVMLNDTTVKIVAWYDNEYGFSTRMCDLAVYMHRYEYEHRQEREESP